MPQHKKKKNKFEFSSEEERQQRIKDIIGFFQDERGEEIGFLAAEQVLDFFLQTMGEGIYRKALKDIKKLLKSRFDDLDVELDMLLDK